MDISDGVSYKFLYFKVLNRKRKEFISQIYFIAVKTAILLERLG